jgi:hypothetical protein
VPIELELTTLHGVVRSVDRLHVAVNRTDALETTLLAESSGHHR